MDHIPSTPQADKMRAAWELMGELGDTSIGSFEDYYASQSVGGTPNSRAAVANLFYCALNYWPDYFAPTDGPAVAAWAGVFDEFPLITPDVAEAAVEWVAARSDKEPGLATFLLVARRLTGEAI